ncbi:hypothetical protein BGX27_003171, partial [Mortierella sp. AM989]
MSKKPAKENDPLKDVPIPNSFYFTTNAPEQYNAVNYFKTFADLQCSKKEILHTYWRRALDTLVACSIRRYQAHGQRLLGEWNTPGKGLGDFWKSVEGKESEMDQLRTTTSTLKKRAIQSVQRHTLNAFNAVDKNLRFDDGNDTQSTSKRQRQSTTMNNNDVHEHVLENAEPAAVPETRSSNVITGIVQDTDDLQGASSDTESAPPRITVSSSEHSGTDQLSKPTLETTPAIYYLAGGGSSDCSRECRSAYMVDEFDISDTLWDYRSKILQLAEQMQPLESVERLQEDSSSSLFYTIGAKRWAAITKNTLGKKVTSEMLSEIGIKAIEISRMAYKDAQDHVDSITGNKEIRRILTSLFEDDFLWNCKKDTFNELEMIQHKFNPFLKAFFGGTPGCRGHWDHDFEPSKNRRQIDDPNAKSRRPDYFLEANLENLTCYLIVFEAKKSRQTSPIQTDTEKAAHLLKDSMDSLARAAVDINNIKLFGIVVKASVYTMELPAKGLYIMKSYAVFYAPRSKDDLAVIGPTLDVLMNMRAGLEVLISQ